MEEPWQKWLIAAVDSFAAARLLEEHGHTRSCASRCYYAAYQGATALLLYAKQVPPVEREAWSHEVTPELVQKLPAPFWVRQPRNQVASRLGDLYKLRLRADYKFEGDVGTETFVLRDALKSSSHVVRTIISVLITGR